MRMEESLPKYHEDHIAGKGEEKSLQHYNLVHNFSNVPSHENSRSKGSNGQGMGENLKRFRRGTWRKSEVRKRWQGRRAQKFILPH